MLILIDVGRLTLPILCWLYWLPIQLSDIVVQALTDYGWSEIMFVELYVDLMMKWDKFRWWWLIDQLKINMNVITLANQ